MITFPSLGISLNPSRVAFTVFGKDIYWYGIIIAAAVFFGILICLRRSKRYGIKQDDLIDFALWTVPIAVICARLYYVAFEWENYAGDLWKILRIWEGGLAIYGAIIGGVITAIIFCRARKLSFWALADIVAPALVLGQAMGRWGNFFNQEAFGPLVTNPDHMWFPLAVKIEATGTIHYATFFYESAWCFLIFAFILIAGKKFKHRGDCFLWYAMLYALERGFVEGLRTDSLYIGDIRVSQALSFVVFVAIAAFMIWRLIKEKRTGALVGEMPYFATAAYAEEMAAEAAAKDSAPEEPKQEEEAPAGEENQPDSEEEAAPSEEPEAEEEEKQE